MRAFWVLVLCEMSVTEILEFAIFSNVGKCVLLLANCNEVSSPSRSTRKHAQIGWFRSVVKEINKINQAELDLGLSGASWHDEYRDSAYVFIGGLHFDLTEGDVITIFSQ